MSNRTKELPLEARASTCVQEFKAPKTGQDALDQMGAEFAAANLLRQFAEKRYDAAKQKLQDNYTPDITALRERASDAMMKTTITRAGEDWQVTFTANKPSTRVNVDELRTELIKRGIDVGVIDKAIAKVEKKSTPALIITAGAINGD